MVFASLSFLILFLVPVGIIYFFLPAGYRNYWLFAASIAFYMLGKPGYVLLLLFMILWSYWSGLMIESAPPGRKKVLLWVYLAVEIGILVFFKYSSLLSGVLPQDSEAASVLAGIALPVGISFYTFQAISYTVDVYRGGKAQKNPFYFGLYVSFFPQLIAGPIVRYSEIETQLTERKTDWAGISEGLLRFSMGLCKKVLLANTLGQFADHVFRTEELPKMNSLTIWLGILSYALQIYFDFSGYSDMAIGLGRIFGFRLPENFRYPYTAGTAAEFWRRWHMTLSRWFRDYVYIPLGGNRKGFRRECLALMIVWGLTGIWHGAGGNYLLWGLLWGLLLILERSLIRPEERGRLFRAVYRMFFLIWILGTWVIFRSDDPEMIKTVFAGMLSFRKAEGRPYEVWLWLHDMWPYLTAGIFLALGGAPAVKKLAERWEGKRAGTILYAVFLAGMAALTILSLSFLVNRSYNPFLYFQF